MHYSQVVMTLDLVRRYLIMNNDMSGLDDAFDNAEETTKTEVIPEKSKVHLSKGDDVIKSFFLRNLNNPFAEDICL